MYHRSILLALLCTTPTFAVPIVNEGTISTLTGPDDLMLDPDNTIYAVDVFGDMDRVVNGVTFTTDTNPIAGYSITTTHTLSNWAANQNFGASADAANLSEIMRDIRWSQSPSTIDIDLDVTAGETYVLQMAFEEGGGGFRAWDIEVDGVEVVDEFFSLAGEPGGAQDSTVSTLYTLEFEATDDNVDIVMGNLFGNNDGGDRNPILQALVLTQIPQAVPEPASILLWSLLAAGVGGLYWRRRQA